MKNNKYSTKTFESVVKAVSKKAGMEEEYQFALLKEEWKEIIGEKNCSNYQHNQFERRQITYWKQILPPGGLNSF